MFNWMSHPGTPNHSFKTTTMIKICAVSYELACMAPAYVASLILDHALLLSLQQFPLAFHFLVLSLHCA